MSCTVNFCKNRRVRGGLRFYSFPSEPKQRVLWFKAARRWDLLKTTPQQTRHRRICSAHFVTGTFSKNPTHPDYVPSIFPFNQKQEYSRVTQRVQRFIRHETRAKASGASFTPLYAPGHPSGRLHGQTPVHSKRQSPEQPSVHPTGTVFLRLPVQLPPGQVQVPPTGPPPSGQLQAHAQLQCTSGELQVGPSGQRHPVPLQGKDVNEPRTTVLLFYKPLKTVREEAAAAHEDHNYSQNPLSAPVERQESEETSQHRYSGDSKGTEENETNVSHKETQEAEAAQTTVDSPNKQTKAQTHQNSDEHPKPLLCPVCGHYSWSIPRFAAHVQKHVDELFTCKVCNKRLRSKLELERHMPIHTGEKNYCCSYCGKCFSLRKSMLSHERWHRAGFGCSYCGMQLRNENALERHLLRHEEQTRREKEQTESVFSGRGQHHFECSVCGRSFKMQSTLDDHMSLHTGERRHQCSICAKRFHTKEVLRTHTKLHTQEKKHICSFCDLKFWKNNRLQAHILSKHTPKTFECTDCGRKYPTQSKMEMHAKIHTQDKDRPYSCSVCLQTFESNETAEEHVAIHKKERELKELSGESVEHGEITVKYSGPQFLCTECGKTFRVKSYLDKHMQWVHTKEKLGCTVCDLKFKFKESLNKHMMLHTGEKPFSCSVCQKRFRVKQNLKLHMMTHSADKPFTCTICGASFRLQMSLYNHKALHKQPVSCTMCPKQYKTVKQLNNHMTQKHGSGDYHCSLCQKRFMSKMGLHAHVAVKHFQTQNCEDKTLTAAIETKSATENISSIN